MGGHEYIKMEWGPLCSVARVQGTVEVVATFRTSTVWKIDAKVLQKVIPGIAVSVEELKNELEDLD